MDLTKIKPLSSATFYKESLCLRPHIEGGHLSEVYRSTDLVQIETPGDPIQTKTKSAGTLSYFLLEKEDFSAWHKLSSDEIWHFYDGTLLLIHSIDPLTSEVTTHLLGNPTENPNATFHCVIPKETYMAAELQNKTSDSFALVGCTVNPGFVYEDFKCPTRTQLLQEFPDLESKIYQFTR